MRFAKEAWPFVVPFWALAGVLGVLGFLWSGGAAALLGLLVLLFFRDPQRFSASEPAIVLSAADGLVTAVDRAIDPEIDGQLRLRVVTFLSVFDVHVQRAPVAGTVAKSVPRRGKKLPAFRTDVDKANHSHLTVLRTEQGLEVGIRQIAGLVARRVVPYLRSGDRVERGDLMGVIKFGSRVDVLLPGDYRALVAVGDRVRCGETPIATPASELPPSAPPEVEVPEP